MRKHIYLSNILKKISNLINSLILKNSKTLKLQERKILILQFISAKRVFAASILLIILSFSYLSIPIFYNKTQIRTEIKSQLLKNYSVNFKFSGDMKYNLFPRPNYKFENVQILNKNGKNFVNIKDLKIFLDFSNFFSSNNLRIKEVFLTNAKFDIYKNNLDFFFNLLNNDFSKSKITILDSFIFFRNNLDEVLFINKIKHMKYFYDLKIKQNILNVKNEIFNIPYSLEIYDDKIKKKIFSKISIQMLRLLFESEYSYDSSFKKGLIDIINNKNKSKIDFSLTKEKFSFELNDKMKDLNFRYDGKIYLKPFYLDLNASIKKLDFKHFTNPNSILLQFLKTEIFNNKNLNVASVIEIKKIYPFQKLVNLLLNFRIKEGLIDLDDSRFSWSDYADFRIFNSYLYINDSNLILDGKLNIVINDYNEIYKFFQTPRNFRKEIKDLEFEFNYNFDQATFNILNLKINGQNNLMVGEILNQLISQESVLQNRIYLKNIINKAIKAYSG